jgi:hypothetical protein
MKSRKRSKGVFAIFTLLLPPLLFGVFISPARGEIRGVVNGHHVRFRIGPGTDYRTAEKLDSGVGVAILDRKNGWLEVRTPNSKIVWCEGSFIRLLNAPPSWNKQGKTSANAVVASRKQPPRKDAKKPVIAPPSPKTVPNTPANSNTNSIYSQTRSDANAQPLASPGATLWDAIKMMLYLIPILIMIVLALRFLKAYYERTGGFPNLKTSILGSWNLINARQNGGSNIRVVESLPLGSIGLHLVEVRGRLLLISSGASGATLIKDLTDEETNENKDFQTLLNSTEMETMNSENVIADIIGELDETIKDARNSISSLRGGKDAK